MYSPHNNALIKSSKKSTTMNSEKTANEPSSSESTHDVQNPWLPSMSEPQQSSPAPTASAAETSNPWLSLPKSKKSSASSSNRITKIQGKRKRDEPDVTIDVSLPSITANLPSPDDEDPSS